MDTLKNIFIEDAISHGNAILIGENKKANKMHKKLMAYYEMNKKDSAISQLYLENLTHPNESVRIWSATFLLKTNPNKAVETLTELSQSSSIFGLSAKSILIMWNNGQLELL
ncbi:MAG: DUF2019 domain-containing protein [Bacteroidales bacterium]|nr:DUF2019 domain-containing protein [Bacteroidales bacterium]